jgi:hypothetical protein
VTTAFGVSRPCDEKKFVGADASAGACSVAPESPLSVTALSWIATLSWNGVVPQS